MENENSFKIEIHRIKNQYESEAMSQIQNLRRSQHGNNEIQELNIRKLKDEIEDKNYEIENLRREMKLKSEELKAEVYPNVFRMPSIRMRPRSYKSRSHMS